MAGASEQLHEERSELSPEIVDRHRALVSLQEELEAVDWYAQRADVASDAELRAILTHNGNEEKEHAAMVLEWLRRRDPVIDEMLRTYLFTEGEITAIEEGGDWGEPGAAAADGSLSIGSLRRAPASQP